MVETFIISSVLPETHTKVSRIVITTARFSSDFVKRHTLTTIHDSLSLLHQYTLSTFIICNSNWILQQTVSLYLQSKAAICGGLLANVFQGNLQRLTEKSVKLCKQGWLEFKHSTYQNRQIPLQLVLLEQHQHQIARYLNNA